MIITENRQRLCLTSWEYNACKIINALEKIVLDNGGRVKRGYTAIISNRSLTEAVNKARSFVKRMEEFATPERKSTPEWKRVYLDRVNQLERLESYNNEPLEVTQLNYISFVLNGIYYYYQLPDNPFFDFLYQKAPITDGTYYAQGYLDRSKNEWMDDCFLMMNCSDADIKEAAYHIFNTLQTASYSRRTSKNALRKIDF